MSEYLELFDFGSFMFGVSFTFFVFAAVSAYEASRLTKEYKRYLEKLREIGDI